VVPQCFILGREPPHPGKSRSSDSNNRCYCQILRLLSVELKFETLLEIQFSETQQTNQRQQDHAKRVQPKWWAKNTIYAKCTRDFRRKEGLMDQFTTPEFKCFISILPWRLRNGYNSGVTCAGPASPPPKFQRKAQKSKSF